MNKSQALEAVECLSSQHVYYKRLDIAGQITQINAIRKLMDCDIKLPSSPHLSKLLKTRESRLDLSIRCLMALDEDPSVIEEYLMMSSM